MATGDQDKALAGLLRRSLAHDPGVTECPDANILAAYGERCLDSSEMTRYDVHLSECPRCREQMAAMVRGGGKTQPVAPRAWLWDWRLIASAVTALLILTVWVVGRSTAPRVSHTANEPLVAIAPPAPGPIQQQTLGPALPSSKSLEAPLSSRPALGAISRESPSRSPRADIAQKEPRRDLPLNGRDLEDLKKLKTQTIQPALGQLGASPLITPAAPIRPPDLADHLTAPAPAAPAADVDARTRQMQSAATVSSFGRADQQGAAQSTQQLSAATIIRTPDPRILWRIASSGFIERSQDAGATWHGQQPEPNAHFTSGTAPTTKTLWLVGERGVILVTTDTIHWKRIFPPIPADFTAVAAKSASSAVLTAADGQRFETHDGGRKWIPVAAH
jgi:hypothetical protein